MFLWFKLNYFRVKLTDHVATTPLDDDDEDLMDTLFNEAPKDNILNDGVINRYVITF